MKFLFPIARSSRHEPSIQSGRGQPHSKTLARVSGRISLSVVLALLFGGSVSTYSQPVTIRAFAGSTIPGSTNAVGTSARFTHPAGIGADSSGNIYIADTENSTIRKITPDGNVSTLAGLAGNFGGGDGIGASARFYGPEAVAVNTAGQLFVADSANNTIRKIVGNNVGTFAGIAGVSNSFDGAGANAQFYHPEGIATDLAGNIYVADTWNHTIRKITSAGAVTTLAGLAGNFGAADGTNSKARFDRPTGLAVDAATNIFVADSLNHTIRKITPMGSVSTIAGLAGVWGSADGTNSDARFYLPEGIGIAPNGDLFITDSGNQTLRKISLLGTNWVVSTVAGLSGFAGSTNGTGSNAQFYFPAGIGFDNAGYLYVADTGNNMIRSTRVIQPLLQFAAVGNQFVLSWPLSAEGFVLESSANLGPSASWSPVTNNVVTMADSFVSTNAITNSAYFRLHLQ